MATMDNTEEQGARFHLINISLGFLYIQSEDKPERRVHGGSFS